MSTVKLQKTNEKAKMRRSHQSSLSEGEVVAHTHRLVEMSSLKEEAM
jgi:hypothetical protein